tara:strand:+ start:2925 stop:3092 length:168 start_codon:yes stop_codon:yes gene_type:complete
MSYIDLGMKDISRMISIMSEHFGKKPMSFDDVKLRKKLEAMYLAEKTWNEDADEE